MALINMTPKHSSKHLPLNHLDKIKMEARERKRNVLYLILGYLQEHMLEMTAECLVKEAQLDCDYKVCENVELDIILQEYQGYYYTKFQKYPKVIRKLNETEQKQISRSVKTGKSAKRSTATPTPPKDKSDSPSESEAEFQFEIKPLNQSAKYTAAHGESLKNPKPKPCILDLEHYTSDSKDLINQISKQAILQHNMNVPWTDCVGLQNVIEILKESTIYPLRYPELFKDINPWKGVLLHGPPGTGKTLLAKALVSESQTTFFNITSSTFISKWRGESEKMLKYLFEMAKLYAPSTIFFDEIDALVSGTNDTQHEASKRFNSELLMLLDGISSIDGQVCVLASTNSPWDLDNALLRRFDKRILVDMPGKDARIQILEHCLQNTNVKISQKEYEEFGMLTEQYSGSDIKCLSKEVTMSVLREKIKALERGNKNASNRTVTFPDIKRAVQKIRPATSSLNYKKYYQWQNEHGAL